MFPQGFVHFCSCSFMLNTNGFVMTPYLWIRRKSKESKEIDPAGKRNSPKSGDERIGQVFCLRHHGFDRVGPKGGRRRFAIRHFRDMFSHV